MNKKISIFVGLLVVIAIVCTLVVLIAVPVSAGPANCLRDLPAAVQPGQTFTVTVTFTAPASQFNSIGLTDNAPADWAVNSSTCTPNASYANPDGNKMEYGWNGPTPLGLSSQRPTRSLFQATLQRELTHSLRQCRRKA